MKKPDKKKMKETKMQLTKVQLTKIFIDGPSLFSKIKDKAFPPWFKIENKGDKRLKIDIYDNIGGGFFFEGLTAKGFRRQIKDAGAVDEIEVHINSNGGAVFEGFAIYETLKSHDAKVNVYVDGIAASIASVIAMAGDSIIMADNAYMMVHSPRGIIFGKSKELRKQADLLDKLNNSIVDTYMTRVSVDRDEVLNMMEEETWLNASDCIEKGFADSSTEKESDVSAFMGDRYSAFHNIPSYILALTDRKDIPDNNKEEDDEMKPEDLKAILNEALKPVIDDVAAVRQSTTNLETRVAKVEKTETKESKSAPFIKRIEKCVADGKMTPSERDHAVTIIDKLSDDGEFLENYVVGFEGRKKLANGILNVEVTSDGGSQHSCILDKEFTAPSKDGGSRVPKEAAVRAFDAIGNTKDYNDFRAKVYAAAGERIPPQVTVTQEAAAK